MRMSITVDKELLEEAQSILGKKTKKDVIEEALRELVRRKRREEAIDHAGKIDIDLDINELMIMREKSDLDPNAPGFAFADNKVIASTYNVDETVQAVQKYHKNIRAIDGVISIAADVPLTVASVAETLGLPGISIETALLASNKLAMKQRFADSGIPIPWFSQVESLSHLRHLTGIHDFPLVLKPVDSRGSRGVLKLNQNTDLDWAYQHSLQYSPSSSVIVEEYLEGCQISTESIIIGSRSYTPGFSDRNYEYLDRFAPYIIENGGQQPSTLSSADVNAVSKMAEKSGCAMGIKLGIAKGDMVLTKDGPKVTEIAARLSGGWFSTDQIPLATGVDIIGVAIRLSLGEEVLEKESITCYQKGVAIRYFFPKPGRVIEIKNVDRFKNTPWVHKIGFFVIAGDIVEPVTNHTKRAGFVITKGADRAEAVARAMEVVETIQIETIPINDRKSELDYDNY